MNQTLSLFPVRVPIGRAQTPDGRTVDVLMTPEFARALSDLLARVGGPSGMGSDDLATLAAMPLTPAQLPAAQVDTPIEYGATLAAMARRIDMLEQQLASALNGSARLAEDVQQVAMVATFRDPFTLDWTRPGQIGAATPNTGKFTTLSTTDRFTLGKGMKISGAATLGAAEIALFAYEHPVGRYYIGDGTGYSFAFSQRTGGVTTDLVTVTDAGHTSIKGGFGCNGKAAQGPKVSGGTLAGVIQALIDNGILSS